MQLFLLNAWKIGIYHALKLTNNVNVDSLACR